MKNFLRVLHVSLQGVIFMDSTGQVIFLKHISDIIQFELEAPYQNYQPHNHYEVSPYVIH